MKICPTCQTRYEEEILRFCIKDGTPLVDVEAPVFTELPSQSVEEDAGEITIVRRPSAPEASTGEADSEAPKLVIRTTGETPHISVPPPRQRRQAPAQQAQAQPNIFKVIVLTILGTLVVLAGIGLLIWSLRSDNSANTNANQNTNLNANIDTNLNTNLNMNGFNMNTNTNLNWNVNFNVNANANVNTNVNVNANRANVNANVNVNAAPKPSPSPAANTQSVPQPTANRPAANRPAAANTARPPEASRPRSVTR